MITIDDGTKKVRLEEFGFRVLMEHNVAHTASISTTAQSIPGRVGLIPVKQQVGSKAVSMSLRRLDRDEITANYETDRLLDVLFDDLYQPRPLKIIMDYDKDKYMNVYVSGDLESVRRSIISEMPLSFVAYDPQRYSIVHADEVTWGSTEITFESTTYTYGHKGVDSSFNIKGAATKNIDVIGLALQPTISIWGKATNLVITNQGKKITVGTFANKLWEIDCEKYIAYQDGVEKMIPMDKFLLRKGVNNIQFSGTDMDIDVTIKFRDRWK